MDAISTRSAIPHRQGMIRLGLIGLGWVGKVHAAAALNLPDCQLAAICDVDEGARPFAETHGANFYKNYEELLDKEPLDGVIVALPNHLHAPVGIECARRGCHILMEKPLAPTRAEADRLLAAAAMNGVKLLVGYHRRFNAAVGVARRFIAEGGLGRLIGVTVMWALRKDDDYYRQPWRREPGAGPIENNLSHEIDTLRFICGDMARIYAETGNRARGFAVEDSAGIVIRFKSGVLGSIFVSDAVASPWAYELTTGENPEFPLHREECYHFLGTEGSLTFPGLVKLSYQGPGGNWRVPLKMEKLPVSQQNPYICQLEHFCRVIRGQEEPINTGEDARKTQEALWAIVRSRETGRPVELD